VGRRIVFCDPDGFEFLFFVHFDVFRFQMKQQQIALIELFMIFRFQMK